MCVCVCVCVCMHVQGPVCPRMLGLWGWASLLTLNRLACPSSEKRLALNPPSLTLPVVPKEGVLIGPPRGGSEAAGREVDICTSGLS